MMTYENFKTLYFSLKSVRQIQGYGCFFRIKDTDVDDTVDSLYDDIITKLRSVEEPKKQVQTPEELISDHDYILISRKKIYKHIREIDDKEKRTFGQECSS